ncbi:hypothetical protein PYCC9005_005250 [Savitreella phatthalungensis]
MGVLSVVFAALMMLVLPIYFIYKPPDLLISYFEYRFPSVIFRLPTTERVVALTIDDAPSHETLDILDVLDRHGAVATFFVIGRQCAGLEDILDEILRRGHSLANHAWNDEPSRLLPADILNEQIHDVETIVQAAYDRVDKGRMARLFRPGSGFFTANMLKQLSTIDYTMVLGNIYPHDPQIPYPMMNARHVVSMARPGGIIICHDRRSWTAPMLDIALPKLQRLGFSTISLRDVLQL